MNNVELARTLSWRELEIANTELWAKWKGKTHFSRNEKNVFVKPYEQRRACSYIVMARIGYRQHEALGEVERQNALFEERERTIQIFRNQCNESIETKNHKKIRRMQHNACCILPLVWV